MKFLQHNQLDFKKWDKVILDCPSPLVFAQSFYLNATSPGWCALVKGNYEAVMPLPQGKKLGLTYLLQPPFTPQLGIFGKEPSKAADDFFSFIQKNYKFIDIELNFTNAFANFSLKPKTTYIINFKEKFSHNTNTRRNISKAQKLNMTCGEVAYREGTALSKKYLNPFLKQQLKIKAKQVKQFEQLLVNSAGEKFLKTFIVKDAQHKITAIGHFISNGRHAVFLKGTNLDKDAKSGSMHLLMDHAIEYYKNENVEFFDFGGGQVASIARFFSGLGGTPLEYYHFKKNNLPAAVRWLKK